MKKNIIILLFLYLLFSMISFVHVGSYLLNLDGDCNLTSSKDKYFWNPHKVDFVNATWNITFNDFATMYLNNSINEDGHISTGMWWTTSFVGNKKVSLTDVNKIVVDFDVKLVSVSCNETDSWLRIGLACAFETVDNAVLYTEVDFWDSPATDAHENPELIYAGGDVVEFKYDQIDVGSWKHYSIDIYHYISKAWSEYSVSNGKLESVYIVIESQENDSSSMDIVELNIDNLWITVYENTFPPFSSIIFVKKFQEDELDSVLSLR